MRLQHVCLNCLGLLWLTLTLQLAGYPAEDPLHQAPCILSTLRLRHRVRSNIRQGSCQQCSFQHPAGMSSLHHFCHASLDRAIGSRAMVIRDLASGALLHRWPLPNPLYAEPAHDWQWGSQALASRHSPGTVLVDTAMGACTLLESAGLLSSWSIAGLLLVQTLTFASPDRVLSAINASGTAVHTVRVPLGPGHLCASWSPDGRVALLLHQYTSQFLLWELSAGCAVPHVLTGLRVEVGAWSLDSQRIAFHCSYPCRLLLWSAQGQCLQRSLSLAAPPIWGSHGRLALLSKSGSADACRTLQLYTASATTPLVRLSRVHFEGDLAFASVSAASPDGSLLAVATQHAVTRQQGLFIISFDGSWRQHFQLSVVPARLEWARTGASLLASNTHGTHHVLMDFA